MDFEKLKEIRNTGFIKEIGFETTEIREGYARGEVTLAPKHGNPIGSIHGGVIFTIADTIGGAAATSRGRFVTTLSGNINYLRPAIGSKKLFAESAEIKVGKNVCVYDVMITDDTGRKIARATMTYYYLKDVEL
ncbi:MAG: PaaI family thioesterase [Clostridiales bacterium]|nr:PaaI family thioesterase [Clostridiales bacterium]